MTDDLVFLVVTYNEENEILDLLTSVMDLAKIFVICDDQSTDNTLHLAEMWGKENNKDVRIIHMPQHSGLPEMVKTYALSYIKETIDKDAWVLLLDADERIPQEFQDLIFIFLSMKYSEGITHVWFNMQEVIEGERTRGFLKCRLFRAGYANYPDSIHKDEHFDGQGANFNWLVIHRKSEAKQRMREKEYLETYKKLLNEGKVSEEWVNRCKKLHYFEKGD